jgi:hypothetical protein
MVKQEKKLMSVCRILFFSVMGIQNNYFRFSRFVLVHSFKTQKLDMILNNFHIDYSVQRLDKGFLVNFSLIL